MQRLLLLMSAPQPAQLESELRARASRLSKIAGSIGGALRLAVQLDDDPLASPMPGELRAVKPLQGLLEVSVDGDAPDPLLHIVSPLLEALDGCVNRSGVSVSIGQVHELLPAVSDTVLVTIAAHRLAAITPAQCHNYWLNVHAPLALSMLDEDARAALGYQQVHVCRTASEQAAGLAAAQVSTFDAVLQIGLTLGADLPHLTRPDFAEIIMKDERNFVDHTAHMLGAFLRTLPTEGLLP